MRISSPIALSLFLAYIEAAPLPHSPPFLQSLSKRDDGAAIGGTIGGLAGAAALGALVYAGTRDDPSKISDADIYGSDAATGSTSSTQISNYEKTEIQDEFNLQQGEIFDKLQSAKIKQLAREKPAMAGHIQLSPEVTQELEERANREAMTYMATRSEFKDAYFQDANGQYKLRDEYSLNPPTTIKTEPVPDVAPKGEAPRTAAKPDLLGNDAAAPANQPPVEDSAARTEIELTPNTELDLSGAVTPESSVAGFDSTAIVNQPATDKSVVEEFKNAEVNMEDELADELIGSAISHFRPPRR